MSPIRISFESEVLPNGLRIVSHHDDKTPIVTVSVWYHVGSKNERPGRTGLAHLFEHLMFEGSAHHRDEYFRPLELAGANVINGTTNRDRTNYFETLPAASLDLALWLESDRMGHLLDIIDQAKLDEQRDVVRNEKRQSENQPYGRVNEVLARSLYPEGHPYSWPIIGRMEDLDAATLDDVESWYETWYRPDNAVLVISGDVDATMAFERGAHFFGAIPAGPPRDRPGPWIAALDADRRVDLEDRVPQARIYRGWNVPPVYTDDYNRLGLLARVLSQGKTSRLYQRLVYEEQVATDASSHLWGGEMGSSFLVQVSCAPDADPERVESMLDEELGRILEIEPSEAEVERARRRSLSGFVHGLERTGGFGGKSEVLAHGTVFDGRPDAYLGTIAAIESARSTDLSDAARRWLATGALTLTVRPTGERSASASAVDRSRLPSSPPARAATLPTMESERLGNRLEVVFLERGDLPLAHFSLVSDSGFAADEGSPRGTAALTMAAIDEGTSRRTTLELSDHLAGLGARLSCSAWLDQCRLGISCLSEHSGEALDLLAEIARQPLFPDGEVERLKREQMARIRRELATPVHMALRVLPAVLYGTSHPYGMPFTGSGTIDEVESTTREHLVDYHDRWIRPHLSTLICLGDLDRDETLREVDRLLADWDPGTARSPDRPAVEADSTRRILLLDRPGSIQSIVFGGQLVPSRNHSSELALEVLNTALGGSFTSRLNLNLREDKGWTYGAHSLLWSARGERPLLLYSSVQADATAGALREMDREVRDILDGRPLSEDELDKVRSQLVRSLAGRWETLGDVAGDLEEILGCGMPRNYYADLGDRLGALTAQEVVLTAAAHVDPDSIVWVVVGDLEALRPELEKLGWAEVVEIDEEGHARA